MLIATSVKRFGDTHNATTIVDFFEKRFDGRTRDLAMVLQGLMLLVWIGTQAAAVAAMASVLTGISQSTALLVTGVVTILYVTLGGIKIDIISDFIQFWIIVLVFVLFGVYAYLDIGSVSALLASLPPSHLDVFAYGGPTMFFGIIVFTGFVYLGNTTHWQRIFSAENEETARTSFLYLLPLVGLFSLLILFLGLVGAARLSGIDQNQATFALMELLLPSWLLGLGYAALLAVIMSSIDSLLIGGSTILHERFFKGTGMSRARLLTVLVGLLGFGIVYFIPNIVTLSLLSLTVMLIFAPPILAGLFWERYSADAGFWSLLIPTILLAVLFPVIGKSTFLVTTPVGVALTALYDRFVS